MSTHQNQSDTIQCTFKVPDHPDCVVIELQGQKIRFGNIIDPYHGFIRNTPRLTDRGHDTDYQALSVRQCKAALCHYYKNKVQPLIDHPDKDSDNFFWAWLLGALPHKITGWDTEAWKRAFANE